MPFKVESKCCKSAFIYEQLYRGWCVQCAFTRMKNLERKLRACKKTQKRHKR
jgi:hypothetical protein